MILVAQRYVRKPVYVDAIRVTDDNMETLKDWCSGEIRSDPPAWYIAVDVHTPKNERQTKAYVGDWLLSTDKGFKIYTDKAFRENFTRFAEGTSQ
jgi:hypothetical protein